MNNEAEKSISDQLIGVLQKGVFDLTTVAVVADAIAATARFNIWILEVAKKQARDEEMMELVEAHADLTEECTATIKKFNGDRDAIQFRQAIQEITHQLTMATKKEFHR